MHTKSCALLHGGALLNLGNLAWLLEAVQLYECVCVFTLAKIFSFLFGLVILNRVPVK